MKKYLIVLCVFCFILVACPNGPYPVNDGIESCPTAEKHLKDLGCIPKDVPFTKKGKSFTQFCQETMQNGINLHPGCLSKITSCNQMNNCVQQGTV